MPSFIVKPDPDQDFYLNWSTIVDGPTCGGTRAEMMADLRPSDAVPERFDRADQAGTSALWPSADDPAYGWNDRDGFIYEGRGVVRRTNLRALWDRIADDDTADVCDLLDPLDGEEYPSCPNDPPCGRRASIPYRTGQ